MCDRSEYCFSEFLASGRCYRGLRFESELPHVGMRREQTYFAGFDRKRSRSLRLIELLKETTTDRRRLLQPKGLVTRRDGEVRQNCEGCGSRLVVS